MKVSFADVDGARIRYYHEGGGEPLLLVHGFGASADCWGRTIDAFGERYRAVAPDLPGHGLATGPRSATNRRKPISCAASAGSWIRWASTGARSPAAPSAACFPACCTTTARIR